MAETILNLVIEKITNAAVTEVLQLWGVDKQVEKVKHELEWVQAFLKDADTKQIVDERQKQWVKHVRDVAYRIEDAIDNFICEVPQKKPGKREIIKDIFRKTKNVSFIHNLGNEIKDILETLQEISERKQKYGINSLGEGSAGGRRLPVRPPVLPDIEDSDVVGFDKDRSNIIKELLEEGTRRRCVVSIVGQGGLGKTTLAKKVYNSDEVKKKFDIRMWITVSQEFKPIDVLTKIVEQLRPIQEHERGKDESYFLTVLYQALKEKKYLLTIDDVWSNDFWTSIDRALPNDKNGSRILMTSRISDVAKEADPARQPYELDFLTPESSLELFLNKTLLNQENQDCPGDLLDLANQFVKRCGGLPLALVVLGGLLAKKQPTYPAWSKVMQTMNWHATQQKPCIDIIGTSYNDLPFSQKSCFQYFAMFPEDYRINAPSLLQMWIAEGFIPHEDNRTLEDTAESILEDLVQRSMVQGSERSLDNDSILECRIHDLLRDVAIEKAKDDNFLTVCSTIDSDALQSCGRARRVAVHNINCNEVMKFASPNLRTLLCFNSQIPDCSRHRLIKVFSDNPEFSYDQADMKWFQGLSQLKYLQLRKDKIDGFQGYFKKLISGMKFLQTIDVFTLNQKGFDLPDCLWHMRTLRHLHISSLWGFVFEPPATTDLPNLQTLGRVRSHKSWDYTNLPNLPNLCHLGIEISEELPWGLAAAFLQTLKKLVSLVIKGEDIPTEVVNMKGFPFYQHLTSLFYKGSLSCHGLDVTMFPTHLTQLKFHFSNLQHGHMVILEKLQGLKSLELCDAYENQTMKCSARGFPRLQQLSFSDLNKLEEWEIEEGAMPMLKHLTILSCPELQVPHGLQHLTTLTDLTWYLYGDNSGPSKAKKIRNICKHVPSITIKGG